MIDFIFIALLTYAVSKSREIADNPQIDEYSFTEPGFSLLPIQNETKITVDFNNGQYTLFLLASLCLVSKLSIDENDINSPGMSLVRIVGTEKSTIVITSKPFLEGTLDVWLIPSSLCFGDFDFLTSSPQNSKKTDSTRSASGCCIFGPKSLDGQWKINFGYEKSTEKIGSLYTQIYDNPVLTLSMYEEQEKYEYPVPFIVQFDSIANNPFLFTSLTKGAGSASTTATLYSCTVEGCKPNKRMSTDDGSNNHQSYSITNINTKGIIIGVVIAVAVVAVVAVFVSYRIIKKKKERNIKNCNLMDPSAI